MKKFFTLVLAILSTIFFASCGGESNQNSPDVKAEKSSEESAPVPTKSNSKSLVVYFSRTGEEYNVGTITRGNTAIVAEMIAAQIHADTFEIEPATPYPDEYEPCTEIAKQELESNARPALANNIDNLAQYDTIFIGYPIWWGSVPRILLTFLEANDFSGKTIVPFCTHGGSGLANTEREIADSCPNAKILSGVAIVGRHAQNEPAAVQNDVAAWLKGLGY